MSKNKEVTTTETKEVVAANDINSWGDSQMTSDDLVIPKLMLMQGLSELVADEDNDVVMGDMVHSLTKEVLAKAKDGLNIIPIYMDKVWYVSKFNGKKFEFDSVVPVTSVNAHLPWNDVDEEGVEIQRTLSRNIYCLLEGHDLPFTVSFKGKSAKCGKVIGTQMYVTNKGAKLPPPAVTLKLTAHKETNNKGTYYVYSVAPVKQTSSEDMKKAFGWYELIMQGKTKVHEEAATETVADADQGDF